MDGSTVDFIVIPIIAIISLAAWLIPIYWADSHPRRSTPTSAPASPRTTEVRPASLAEAAAVPGQPAPVPAPVGQGSPSQGNVPRQAAAVAEDAIPAQR